MELLVEIENFQGGLKGLLIVGLLVQSYIDLKWRLLLDEVNIGLAFAGVVYGWALFGWQQSFLGALFFGGVMACIYALARGGMGLGDVKLGIALGFWLGIYGSWLCLVLALFLGAVTGVVGLLLGHYNRQTALPFGPFLSVAAFLLILFKAPVEGQLLQLMEGW